MSTASARAYVATVGFAPRSRRGPSRSAISDSPRPEVRSVTEAVRSPRPRAASRGETQSRHIGRISRGGPGNAMTTRPSGRSTHQPGAVPLAFGMAVADGISHACFRFVAANGTFRRAKRSRSHVSRPASTDGVWPIAAAIDSRVRSSGVGPRPPVETTRSTSERAVTKASRTTDSSSGSAVTRRTSTPAAVRSAASSPALVSRVSPTVISEPIERISARSMPRTGRW